MNRVLVDDGFRSKLDEFHTQTEFCDKEGRVLGVYIPARERERCRYERAKGQFSLDEIERRCREQGGLTTPEVMQKLRDLEGR